MKELTRLNRIQDISLQRIIYQLEFKGHSLNEFKWMKTVPYSIPRTATDKQVIQDGKTLKEH